MDLISSPFDVEIHPSVRITVVKDGNLAWCSDNIIGALSFNVSPFVHFCLCVTCQSTSFHSQGHQKPWGHILSAPVPKGDKEYLSPCIHIQSSRGRPWWVHLGSHTYPQSQQHAYQRMGTMIFQTHIIAHSKSCQREGYCDWKPHKTSENRKAQFPKGRKAVSWSRGGKDTGHIPVENIYF